MGQHHPEIIIQTPIYYVKSHKMLSNLPKNNLEVAEQSISSTKLGSIVPKKKEEMIQNKKKMIPLALV
jgi:hypothetical protein